LKDQWQSKNRFAVLIADYPGHGTQYSNPGLVYDGFIPYDHHPEGDPKGYVIEDQIK